MPKERTRQITMYLLPDEMRMIRVAAAHADTALSSYARDVVLKHVAAGSEPTNTLRKSVQASAQAAQDSAS